MAYHFCFIIIPSDKALAETQESLKMVKDELEAWQSQHSSLHQKLTHEQAANSTLKVNKPDLYVATIPLFFFQKQLAGLQVECNGLRKLKDEVGCLHDRLQLVAGLVFMQFENHLLLAKQCMSIECSLILK